MSPLHYQFVTPPDALYDFVESFGMFYTTATEEKEVVVIPDGKIDLFFLQTPPHDFRVVLTGLETAPKQRSVAPGTLFYDINLKPLAVEYLLKTSIADVLNGGRHLPDDFWGFTPDDLKDFESFHKKAAEKLLALLPERIDERKRRLFRMVYAARGEISVQELSESIGWGSRQINRYFTSRFGLPLKAYCNILRFRASLEHIANGKIYPELNFTDQNHFIREIKKFSGVVPKELFKNINDRFVLLSVLKQQ